MSALVLGPGGARITDDVMRGQRPTESAFQRTVRIPPTTTELRLVTQRPPKVKPESFRALEGRRVLASGELLAVEEPVLLEMELAEAPE